MQRRKNMKKIFYNGCGIIVLIIGILGSACGLNKIAPAASPALEVQIFDSPTPTIAPTLVPTTTPTPTSAPTANPKGTYLGEFKITGYTPDPAENGGYGVTALGDNLWDSVGWAVAVDPKVIPLKSKIYIEGIGYREARDTGGAIKGNKIDVLTGSNAESYRITGTYKVYLVN